MKKLNNKGFTLLEMMSVLILLIVILLVAVPNITKTIKKDKVNQLEKYEETLCDAAESYINEENLTVSEVSGTTLVSEGYIADSLINPDTKKSVINDSVLVSYGANGIFNCHLR